MAVLRRPATGHTSGGPASAAGEKELLAALFAGDRQAAEELAERTYERVYRALYRLASGNEDLAADLTQETYRKAWKSLAKFNARCQFSTWLYRIAYNTFFNHVRRPVVVKSLTETTETTETLATPARQSDPALDPAVAAPDREAELDARRLEARLRRSVLGLPEELRLTVTARFWGELPVREIAEMEGVTPVAIRKRLRRAFQALRLALEEEA